MLRTPSRSLTALAAALPGIAFLAAILFAAPAQAASPLDRLTEACGVAYHQSIKPPEAVVWTGHNGNRVVILGVSGDRFECLFEPADKPAPQLLTIETTAADKSVTILTGKPLEKTNALIRDHFSQASSKPSP